MDELVWIHEMGKCELDRAADDTKCDYFILFCLLNSQEILSAQIPQHQQISICGPMRITEKEIAKVPKDCYLLRLCGTYQ